MRDYIIEEMNKMLAQDCDDYWFVKELFAGKLANAFEIID